MNGSGVGEAKTIAIIGGGVSGLAAAVAAGEAVRDAEDAARVVVYEASDRVGRSILATGNGRCNFSNARPGEGDYRNAAFVRRVLLEFEGQAHGHVPSQAKTSTAYPNGVLGFFSDHGLMWREEGEGRLYPLANKATSVLEVLRAPIEDGEVTITRAAGSITLPSRFMLVGAMNPCRCGWYGHPSGRCHCTKQQVEKYVEKISGPMLDRMDLHVNVPSVEFEAMRRREKAESSTDVKARVNAARDIQKQRFSGTNITCNAQIIPAMVGEFCTLDAAGEKLLKGAFERLGLTARSHDRLLRVARTIADLDGSEKIEAHHLAEAIQYRNTDILQG